MDLNSLYGYGSNSVSSLLYTPSNSKWRGGVTGWEHKTEKSSDSSSSSGTSSAAKGYLSSVKEHASTINDAIASLTGNKETSAFNSVKATSDDTAVTVSVTDQDLAAAFSEDGTGSKAIEVLRLAAAQKNGGAMLNSSDVSGVNAGKNTFAIEKGGKHFYFNVNVNTTDSNRTVQEKMAAEINTQSQNTGVKASVVYNEKDKTSSLVLTGQETGDSEAFTVRDVSGGNAVAATGAAYTSRDAADAKFKLDGYTMFSSTNEADLGDGIKATFNKVTEDEVTIKAENDTDEIKSAIYDLVNGFNQLRETAVNANSDSGAQALQDKLDSLTSAFGSTLKRVGITLNEDGYMGIDEKKLKESIENGQAEGVFGENSGFTRGLSNIASQAETDPSRYLSYKGRTGLGEEEEASADYYDNLLDSTSLNAHQSTQLNRWDTTSMLFNLMA